MDESINKFGQRKRWFVNPGCSEIREVASNENGDFFVSNMKSPSTNWTEVVSKGSAKKTTLEYSLVSLALGTVFGVLSTLALNGGSATEVNQNNPQPQVVSSSTMDDDMSHGGN